MSVKTIASSMNINLLLTCYKNEVFFFLAQWPPPPSQRSGDLHNFSLFKKNKREPLGFSESVSSLEKEVFLIEIITVEVTKNLPFFCAR